MSTEASAGGIDLNNIGTLQLVSWTGIKKEILEMDLFPKFHGDGCSVLACIVQSIINDDAVPSAENSTSSSNELFSDCRALHRPENQTVINDVLKEAYSRVQKLQKGQSSVEESLIWETLAHCGWDVQKAMKRLETPNSTEQPQQYRRKGEMKVTLISGFLGSGKTTLLSNILHQKNPNYKCAVIVNEISEFNIDAIAIQGLDVIQEEEKIVEMSNGCVCCTLREDLLEQLSDLHQKGFDAAIIEASGISEPMQTAETFFYPHKTKYLPEDYDPADPESEYDALCNFAPLDNTVTVVDASRLIEHMSSLSQGKAGVTAKSTADETDISKLMFEQLEFANVVLLNKIDLIPEASLSSSALTVENLVNLVKTINPHCEVIPTQNSDVPIRKIIDTGNFSPEFLEKMNEVGWSEGLDKMEELGLSSVQPETEEYGMSSMSFVSDRPFHPARLKRWIETYFLLEQTAPASCEELLGDERTNKSSTPAKFDTPKDEESRKRKAALVGQTSTARKERYGNVFRGKGFVWLGNPARLGICASWAQAGPTVNFSPAFPWDQFPRSSESKGNGQQQSTAAQTVDPVINPLQKLTFIGQNLKKDTLTADLTACLLTDSELELLSQAIAATRIVDGVGSNKIPLDVFQHDDFDPFLSTALSPGMEVSGWAEASKIGVEAVYNLARNLEQRAV